VKQLIENFLSNSECSHFIELADSSEMHKATINTPDGMKVQSELRGNDRLIFDDPDLASSLWGRLKEQIELKQVIDRDGIWEAYGLNERFKIYRYEGGQYFGLHHDDNFVREKGKDQSFQTLIMYLNEGYEGGQTGFMDGDIEPKEGRALIFAQMLLHEGIPVKSGVKYVLRTDMMYRYSPHT
jgi:hypothetical protein